MTLILYGKTAAQWWLHATTASTLTRSLSEDEQRACKPTRQAVEQLRTIAPWLKPPLHFLTFNRRDRRDGDKFKSHASEIPYPSGSFASIAPDVYASSPELTFAQLAQTEDELQLSYVGSMLCGRFCRDLRIESHLGRRDPLTTKARMLAYIESVPRFVGKIRMLQGLRGVFENAASPREILLAMRLLLPGRHGGFGLPEGLLNHEIALGKRGGEMTDSSYYVADICWPSLQLVVEYDSDLHLSSEALAHDAIKRNTLQELGYKVITVTKPQLNDISSMEIVARQVAKHCGVRLRTQAKNVKTRRNALFAYNGANFLHYPRQ